jgi:hypothetical protein
MTVLGGCDQMHVEPPETGEATALAARERRERGMTCLGIMHHQSPKGHLGLSSVHGRKDRR